MAVTIITKQHDTKIQFKDTPSINGVVVPPANLAGCTLRFLMKTQDGSAPPVAQPAVINADGTFSYDPVSADVANIGKFQQEWELTYPTSKILTFPNNGYNVVKIIADLG
jgi:hypothetical protein